MEDKTVELSETNTYGGLPETAQDLLEKHMVNSWLTLTFFFNSKIDKALLFSTAVRIVVRLS